MRPRGHFLGTSDPTEHGGTTTPQTTTAESMPGADPGITTTPTLPGINLGQKHYGIPTWGWIAGGIALLALMRR